MCPLFMSITTHAAWAFLIIILSLLINESVLAILFHHFFLLVDFLSRHLWGGYIKLVGLSAVCVFIAHRHGMCWDQTALSLESVSLVCRMINKGPLPHLFPPLLIKLYVPTILIIWPSTYLVMSCIIVYILIIKF